MRRIVNLTRRFKFDAAHYLPDYDGPCSRMHGHTWFVDVEVTGVLDPDTGMLMDFKELSEAMQPILDTFDHTILNEYLPHGTSPTAENLAIFIAEGLEWVLKKTVKSVTVWESPDCCAKYEV